MRLLHWNISFCATKSKKEPKIFQHSWNWSFWNWIKPSMKSLVKFQQLQNDALKKGTISTRVHSGLALVMEITTYNNRQPGGSYSKGNYNSLIFGYSRARLISADGNTKRKKNQNSITSCSKWPDENEANLLISTQLNIWRFSGRRYTSIETVQTCDGIRM